MVQDSRIDGGKQFDWGRTSADYAKYRDIYPAEFYQKLIRAGLCIQNQKVLDLGTGTGVLPRNLYRYGADFTGTDLSAEQIAQAKQLSAAENMQISYFCASAEESSFPPDTFDVVTACQCFFYFRHEILAPKLHRMLKPNGKLAVLYMAWLPFEDPIAGESEKLVLKYNPNWSGKGELRHPIGIDAAYEPYFTVEHSELYDLRVPFTRESWNGRMKACRGVGASLTEQETEQFDREHRKLLDAIAPESFEILHYAAMTILTAKT